MKLRSLSVAVWLFLWTAIYAQNNVPIKTPAVNASQEDVPTSYEGLTFGRSFALGKFKDSGLASNGFSVSYSGSYLLRDKVGLAYTINYDNNPLNQQAFLNMVEGQVPVPYNINIGFATAGSWISWSGYFGLYATFPSDNISFDIRIMGGFLYSSSPAVVIDMSQNGSIVGTVSQDAANGVAPSLCLGINLRYSVSPSVCIIAAFDYLLAKPQFTVDATYSVQTQNGTQTGGSSGNASQLISIGNLSLGIAWIPPKRNPATKPKTVKKENYSDD